MVKYTILDCSPVTRILYQLSGLYPLTTSSTRFSKTAFLAIIINIGVIVVCHYQVLNAMDGKGINPGNKNNLITYYGNQLGQSFGPPIFASIYLATIIHRKSFLRISENIWRIIINFKVVNGDCTACKGVTVFNALLAVLLVNFGLFAKCLFDTYRTEIDKRPTIFHFVLYFACNYYISLTSVHFMMAAYFTKNCFDSIVSVLKKM
jgi:hypothetical protein